MSKTDWKKQDFSIDRGYYFTRPMHGYNAHVFLYFVEDQQVLQQHWEDFTNIIAFDYQAQVEPAIERNNFYICFFTESTVSNPIKAQIEGDTFCARKYVFTQTEDHLEDCCRLVERKLFSFDLGAAVQSQQGMHATGVSLKNFRAYAGENFISFCDKEKKAASFVAIYAPNGVGKTSIIDGVEYVLTGEISRLLELNKLGVTGAIYHNISNPAARSSVALSLEDGNHIRRNVANVAAGKTDLRRNPLIDGKNIVGNDPDIWRDIILPHDKIDTFVTATKPQEQYEEWIEKNPQLKGPEQMFRESYKIKREIQRNQEEEDEQYKSKLEQFEHIKSCRDKLAQLQELLAEYNSISSIALPAINENSEAKDYDLLLNQATSTRIEIEKTELPAVQTRIDALKRILNTGVSVYRDASQQIQAFNIQISELNKQLMDIEELKKLQIHYEAKTKALQAAESVLKPYAELEAYGIEKIRQRSQEYKLQEQTIQQAAQQEKDVHTLEQSFETLCAEIEQFEKKLEWRADAQQWAEQLDKLKSDQEQNLHAEQELQHQQNTLVSKITELQHLIIVLQQLHSAEKYSSEQQIKLHEIVGSELMHKLQEQERIQAEHATQLARLDEQVCNAQREKEHLYALLKNLRNYIETHQELRECPLCHTDFQSWEALYEQTSRMREIDDQILEQQIQAARIIISQDVGRYQELMNLCKSIIQTRIRELEAQSTELQTKQNTLQKSLSDCKTRHAALQEQINQCNGWFIQHHLALPEYSALRVKQHYDTIQSDCNRKIQEKNEVHEQLTALRNTLTRSVQEQRTAQKARIKLMEQPDLFRCIMFYLEHEKTIEHELQQLKARKEQMQAESEQILQRKKLYEAVEGVDATQLQETINRLSERIQTNVPLATQFEPFSHMKDEEFPPCLEQECKHAQCLLKKTKILEQIEKENSARVFFTEYRECRQALDESVRNQSRLKEQLREQEGEFEKRKSILTEEITKQFNQSLMNQIFQKIDPHYEMKKLEHQLAFDESNEKPLLYIKVKKANSDTDEYRPEWYFSSAQLNAVAFSLFFSSALQTNHKIRTIFIDDPIGHFDDMNILGFADLIRSIIENTDWQIVLTTHDKKIFQILKRKLDDNYYSSRFLQLPEDVI